MEVEKEGRKGEGEEENWRKNLKKTDGKVKRKSKGKNVRKRKQKVRKRKKPK